MFYVKRWKFFSQETKKRDLDVSDEEEPDLNEDGSIPLKKLSPEAA